MRAFLSLVLAASFAASPASITRIASPPEAETAFSCDDADPSADPLAVPAIMDWTPLLSGQILPLLFQPGLSWIPLNLVDHPACWALLPNRPDAPRGPPPAG